MGVSLPTIYNAAHRLGLKKSAAFLASDRSRRINRAHQTPAMIATRFQKGLVPHNKGVRRPGWSPGRMSETQFKSGRPASESRNYLPIGTVRICADGYLERKVTDDQSIVPARRWTGVHRLVWEATNGPVPAGHVVVFRPGRVTTEEAQITLDAIELVTRAELMRRNTIHNLPPELADVCRLRGRLVRQINKRSRQHEEQDR
ncbi:MAG: HNH endonuclease [Xanthomonadales bacterium]|nr:HNH endonuclease [Xanthomonadales bacterium]